MAQEIIVHVYQDNAFKPYWTDETNIHKLLQLIENASDHGLDPADYNIDQLHRILSERSSNPSAEIKAEADIMLTETLHEILDALNGAVFIDLPAAGS